MAGPDHKESSTLLSAFTWYIEILLAEERGLLKMPPAVICTWFLCLSGGIDVIRPLLTLLPTHGFHNESNMSYTIKM